jgi:hypothetical protein
VLRHLARLGVLASALGAAFALSGSALAAPTTPVLAPIPDVVSPGSLTVHWSPAAFDPGTLGFYELSLIDITGSSYVKYFVLGTSKTVSVVSGHSYAVCVRAGEIVPAAISYRIYSGRSCDKFKVGARWGGGAERAAWPGKPGYHDDLIFDTADARYRTVVLSARTDDPEVVGVVADSRGVRLLLA